MSRTFLLAVLAVLLALACFAPAATSAAVATVEESAGMDEAMFAEMDAEVDMESELDAELDADADADADADSELDLDTESDAELDSETDAEDELDAEADLEADAEGEAEVEGETEEHAFVEAQADGVCPAAAKAAQIANRRAGETSKGLSANFIAHALIGAGIKYEKTPHAKEAVDNLKDADFKQIPNTYKSEAGDVRVLAPIKGHPNGHMQMWTGASWVSDFRQDGNWPSNSWKESSERSFLTFRYRC